MVVARFNPHHTRGHGGAEADWEHGPERDRDLAEEFAGIPPADHALDAVGALDRLDATVEHSEQRSFASLSCRVLPRCQADVRCDAREPLALRLIQPCEQRNQPYLFGDDHPPQTLTTHPV